MADPLSPDPGRRRLGLHVALFVATLVTTTLAGSWSWAATADAPVSWSGLFEPLQLARGIPYAVLLLLVLGAHEMGHYLACRFYGVPASLPYFIPGFPFLIGTLGAVIRIRGPIPNRRALFDIAAAGPISGFVVALPILVLGVDAAKEVAPSAGDHGLSLGPPLIALAFEKWFHGAADLQVGSLYGAAWVGMLITSMNLFPVGQLDGGHALFAVSPRLHRSISWLAITATTVLVAGQFLALGVLPAYTLWLVILYILRGRHPRLLDETTPLGSGRVAIAILLVAIFVVTFIPVPFTFY